MVGGFSRAVATFSHVGGSFNLLHALHIHAKVVNLLQNHVYITHNLVVIREL